MSSEAHDAASQACHACADACDRCAVVSLAEPQPKLLARCVELAMDCAQLCRLAQGFLARGSPYDSVVCAAVVVLCDACASECEKHRMPHCLECAAACRRASKACSWIAERIPRTGDTPTGTHEAH